jgi:hypothetical protein
MGIKSTLRQLSAVAAAAIFSLALVPPGAWAADPGFCRDYATAAVRQVQAALAVPRCRGGMNGPRWAVEFHIHYDWCLGASYEAAGGERDARRHYIDYCR